ncbi:DUF4157 domain-containing protein [Tenacibaculum sp. FZY0031]|uniref:eCIS core domain-containing protein n=1 Tax=Tenacibaculum sp. FZY0031 TaxID=3116648 RepID=UPI002E9E10A9|nr:DUF4157 domain-containing protein [Tenacibaculum sp. FZY0031]
MKEQSHISKNKTNNSIKQSSSEYVGQRKEATSKGCILTDNRSNFTVQKKENNTGLPDTLKSGIEEISGYSMDDVNVHYNSDKPAQLNAHAYAQGTDIHIASGQEKHLPHETWHVVQQKQGRVQPTMSIDGTQINDNVGLENEADIMGAKALQMKKKQGSTIQKKNNYKANHKEIVQRSFMNRFRRAFGITQHEKNEGQRLLQDPQMSPLNMEVDLEDAQQRLESNVGVKASMASSIGSGLATAIGKPADLVGKLSQSGTGAEALKISGTAGGIGGIIGATGSLIDAGVNLHKHQTGNQLSGDKNLLKLDIASNLTNVGTSIASSVGGFASAVGNTATVTSSALAAGPFAAAGGLFEMIRGGVGAKVASDRERMLGEIGTQNAGSALTREIASFAEDSQETKKKSSIANVVKGGLGLAGGAALLAGTGPIGWGLLGVAALAGLGVKGYQTWRKYKHGKRAMSGEYNNIMDQGELNQGIKSSKKWYHPKFYEKILAHDLVRSSAGGKLSDSTSGVQDELKIINALGLNPNTASAKEITEAM